MSENENHISKAQWEEWDNKFNHPVFGSGSKVELIIKLN